MTTIGMWSAAHRNSRNSAPNAGGSTACGSSAINAHSAFRSAAVAFQPFTWNEVHVVTAQIRDGYRRTNLQPKTVPIH